MTTGILRYSNRDVFFQKAITAPDLAQKAVLARDAFQFVELWLKREKQTDALFYWTQARSFFIASKNLPPTSSPLTAYYCMLNAVKALLIVKKVNYSDYHGVSGEAVASRKSLENEMSELHQAGILAELSRYLKEPELTRTHALENILANLPFIHRAYCLTRKAKAEMFIALNDVAYLRHPDINKVWISAEVRGQHADKRVLNDHMPSGFQIDNGIKDRRVIRMKKRVNWFSKQGATNDEKSAAVSRLQEYHRKLRLNIVSISAPTGLWYLKRRIASIPAIDRYGLTLMMMGMHRLSELARYDPKGLSAHLSGKSNWLLTEFIELSPSQFIDEIACEITGLEFRMPGVRT